MSLCWNHLWDETVHMWVNTQPAWLFWCFACSQTWHTTCESSFHACLSSIFNPRPTLSFFSLFFSCGLMRIESQEKSTTCIAWHDTLLSSSPDLHYVAMVFWMIWMGENTSVCRTESMVSLSSQPKIDTGPQPDWVKEQLLTTMPSASVSVWVLLTRAWALASPPSALSISCCSVNSSSGPSSERHSQVIIGHIPKHQTSTWSKLLKMLDCSQPPQQVLRGVVKLRVCLPHLRRSSIKTGRSSLVIWMTWWTSRVAVWQVQSKPVQTLGAVQCG